MTTTRVISLPENFRSDAPEISIESVPECPVCGTRERSRFASGHDYEMETCRNRWDMWVCASCSCVWLDPRPAVSELGVIYPDTYYSYEMDKNISAISLKGKEILDRWKFAGILKALDKEPRTFLDIGCGDGRYLELFAKRGLPRSSIWGLELSPKKIDELRKAGFNAFCRRAEDCTEIPNEAIDLATMFHVIEHVADPLSVMRRIQSWLAPHGYLVVETPNISAWDARLFRERWWGGYHFPRHWTLFNADSLRKLFELAGLEVVHVGYQTGHSFWMYSFHHLLKYDNRLSVPSLARVFDPLRGVPLLAAFTGFDIARRAFGARTSAILMIGQKS